MFEFLKKMAARKIINLGGAYQTFTLYGMLRTATAGGEGLSVKRFYLFVYLLSIYIFVPLVIFQQFSSPVFASFILLPTPLNPLLEPTTWNQYRKTRTTSIVFH